MKLRDYQMEMAKGCNRAFHEGKVAPLCVLPTGGGKTPLMSYMVARCVANGGRVTWLAHRPELLCQAFDTLQRMGVDVSAYGDSVPRPYAPYAPVQVAMVQTMLARAKTFPSNLLVLDEAHHYVAEKWSGVVDAYKGIARIGCTATPCRTDGVGLGARFDSLVVGPSVRKLIEMGHLVPCEVIAPKRSLRPGEIAQTPIEAYRKYGRGMKTIVFAPHVMAAKQYAEEFDLDGYRVGMVSESSEGRGATVDAYKRGDIDILVNVYVLTEGFDDPPTSCAIIARGCGSIAMYMQIAGRVLRPSRGKTSARLIDLRGVCRNPDFGMPDEDREYSLGECGIKTMSAAQQRQCPVCSTPMQEGQRTCLECGRTPEGSAMPSVTNEELVPYARMRALPPSKQAQALAKWMHEGITKDWKPRAAFHKFKAVFNTLPSAEIEASARKIVNERNGNHEVDSSGRGADERRAG